MYILKWFALLTWQGGVCNEFSKINVMNLLTYYSLLLTNFSSSLQGNQILFEVLCICSS